MKKIYIYPNSAKDKLLKVYNPYMDDLMESADKYFTIINKDKPSHVGILDILKYLVSADIIYFNWIEKLAEKKGGVAQTLILITILNLLKLFRLEIVWTMHNKLTHSGKHEFWSTLIFKQILRKSAVIITHSSEGIRFGESLVPSAKKKILYFPHPVKDRRIPEDDTYEFDILIWGSVAPYKGIHNFLAYLHEKNLQEKYKILIIGKVSSPEYLEEINRYLNGNINLVNEFASNEKLISLINDSGIVLFTYSKDSILSSGVLMDSLGYGANIVGPHVGAFADLAGLNIISTFHNFDEMVPIIEKEMKVTPADRSKKLDAFLSSNTWDKFSEKLRDIL